jgi:hypothetical protein
MIVYKKKKDEFLADVDSGEIGDIVSRVVSLRLGIRVGASEKASWANSLEYMGQVLAPDDVSTDSQVAIEYRIPRTSNRIDFLVAGQGSDGSSNLVIIELKQWSKAEKTMEDGIVRTALGRGIRSVVHPSYQAWSYASLLSGFNEAVHSGQIHLYPCAFLHNYKRDGVIDDAFYKDHLTNAPLFCQTDRKELRSFIADKVPSGDQDDVITKLDDASIRPSKVLAEQVAKMLRGNQECRQSSGKAYECRENGSIRNQKFSSSIGLRKFALRYFQEDGNIQLVQRVWILCRH